jgi:hypothetical protein
MRTQSPPTAVEVHDRSAVDAVVYEMLGVQAVEERTVRWEVMVNESSKFQSLLRIYGSPSTKFVLLHPVDEWLRHVTATDSGLRRGRDGAQTLEMFRSVMHGLGLDFLELTESTKDINERVRLVLEYAEVQAQCPVV